MLYGWCVWSTTSCENIDRVFRQTTKARCACNSRRGYEWEKCKAIRDPWMDAIVWRNIKLQKCCVIVICYMNQIFNRNSDMHSRATRHSNFNLVCPRYHRETEGGRTFQKDGVKLWNAVPIDIRRKETICAFKFALKNKCFKYEVLLLLLFLLLFIIIIAFTNFKFCMLP